MNSSVDIEDLGNEALVFAYGHNVNLYTDVFNISHTSSTKEIYLTYTGLLRELEVAQTALQEYSGDDAQRQYAMRLGMTDSHLMVGMHPRDFLNIKIDAVKRAYDILADKKSRIEYDDCLREYVGSFESEQKHEVTDVSDVSSGEEEEEEEDGSSNDGNDSLYDAPSIQAQVDSDFPLLSSHHHNDDVFDPFSLRHDLPGQSSFSSFAENTFDSAQEPVPISPDFDSAFSATFSGMHPHGHATSMRICALPTDDSDDDSSSVNYDHEGLQRVRLDPEADIQLPSQLSSEEEDELVSFQLLSKSINDFDEKQAAFFNQMDAGLDNIECFSEDDSDIVDQNDMDNMSIASETKEREVEEAMEGQHIWVCLDTCMDEISGTLDDTAVTFEQMCGIAKH